jgi:hypothetical protein
MDGDGALGSAGRPCRARSGCRARSRAATPTRPRPRWDRSSSPVYRPPTSIAAEDPARVSRVDRQINWTGGCRQNYRWRPPETQKSWRRPIFPKGCPLSIFGAGELDFRVRDGNGYGLSASVTRIRCVWMLFGCVRRRPEGRRLDFRWLPPADRAFCSRSSKSESRRGSIHDVPATDPRSVAVEVKPSTVSTAQLHPSPDFHMRPIKQVVSLRSYPVDPVGNLISRRASHLDAFSAYPDRT